MREILSSGILKCKLARAQRSGFLCVQRWLVWIDLIDLETLFGMTKCALVSQWACYLFFEFLS